MAELKAPFVVLSNALFIMNTVTATRAKTPNVCYTPLIRDPLMKNLHIANRPKAIIMIAMIRFAASTRNTCNG